MKRIAYSDRSRLPAPSALTVTASEQAIETWVRCTKIARAFKELDFDADPYGEAETDPWVPSLHGSLPFTVYKCNFTM
jgi:hypothetical protein